MYFKRNLMAAVLAVAALLPLAGEHCLLRREETEEIVLPEDITPRRGNGYRGYGKKKREEVETAGETPKEAGAGAHSISVGTTPGVHSWYCPHRKDGQPPAVPPEMSFITEHGGYFLDTRAGEDDRVIYLTFDAGYENGNVERILDVLKEENVPGAFFVLEHLITANTDLVKRMAAEGHLVCNHTARHRDMSSVTDKGEFAMEMAKLEDIYRDYTGLELAKYYRPPEGKFSEGNLVHADALGYKTIFWSFAYADWDNDHQPSPEAAVKKVLNGTHNGEVLLLHPTSATNAEILPTLIREWKAMGYRFGTLDELTREEQGE